MNFTLGMLNLGSNSLINLQKYSLCTILNGRESQINQFTRNRRNSSCRLSSWGVITFVITLVI